MGPIPGGPAASRRVLQGVERCIDPPPRALAFLRDERPDVLLITPLIGFGTYQADLVRAAKRLGIPVSFPVRSWDNLTNKGLLRDAPDQVLVWNDLQKREAVELHGVRPESVVVTGAPAYDHWFDWQPGADARRALRRSRPRPGPPVGALRGLVRVHRTRRAPVRPPLGRGGPRPRRNACATRGCSSGRTRSPHPGSATCGSTTRRSRSGRRTASFRWRARRGRTTSTRSTTAPRWSGSTPARRSRRRSSAGRCYTILDAQYADTQAGTLHFRYLADDQFGHLHAAGTLEEHAAQLERALDGEVPSDLNERFLRRFVRPFGLDVAATALAVDAIEELGRQGSLSPGRGPAAGPLVRLGLRPLAARAAAERRRQKQSRSRLEPSAELKAAVRRLAETRPETAIAAERWPGSETRRAPLLDPLPALGTPRNARAPRQARGRRAP